MPSSCQKPIAPLEGTSDDNFAWLVTAGLYWKSRVQMRMPSQQVSQIAWAWQNPLSRVAIYQSLSAKRHFCSEQNAMFQSQLGRITAGTLFISDADSTTRKLVDM